MDDMRNQNKRTVMKLLCVVLPLAAVAVGVPHVIRRHKIRRYAAQ
jgi:hypothetical protein